MYRLKLVELGIPASAFGFEYLNDAIQMYKPNTKFMNLYSKVGEKYGVTSQAAERNMRTAIKKISNLTTSEFIARYSVLWENE